MKQQSVFSALCKSTGYVLLFLGSQLAASLLGEVIILCTLLAKGVAYEDLFTVFADASGALLYEMMLLSGLLFLGIAFLIQKKSFAATAGVKRTPASSVAASAFLGFGAYLGASFLIAFTTVLPAVQQSQDAYMEQYEAILSANPSLLAEILYVCLLGPIVEEILCRGLIQNTLKRSMKAGIAIFLSALIFAFVHGNLYQIVFTLPLGLLLGYLSHRFDSVWPAIALHVTFNFSNYPVQLGTYLGYDEESEVFYIFYLASLLFYVFAVPVGVILLRKALKKKEKPIFPPAHEMHAPEEQYEESNNKGESMAAPEFLVVGLGNPGDKYAANRHNCGFTALDYIALRENTTMKNLRFKALTGEAIISGKKVLFMKPQTFMNLSGEAVREAAAFYKIPPERILVIFDDISFAPGIFRIRKNGSAGGHNGIKSIISCLGSDAFPRVKMGVGAPPEGWELMNWVLGNPSPEDQKKIIASLEDVYATVKLFAREDLDRAAQLFNGKTHE